MSHDILRKRLALLMIFFASLEVAFCLLGSIFGTVICAIAVIVIFVVFLIDDQRKEEEENVRQSGITWQ